MPNVIQQNPFKLVKYIRYLLKKQVFLNPFLGKKCKAPMRIRHKIGKLSQ